eukprot:Hpha_TRINITY_DN16690_c0_g1::TRINITY_DN16690_c0_g1_i31::g.183563::m.183563
MGNCLSCCCWPRFRRLLPPPEEDTELCDTLLHRDALGRFPAATSARRHCSSSRRDSATVPSAAVGGLEVFARLPEGKLVPVSVVPEATVQDLMEEVRQAAGLRSAPKLRFLGKRLEPRMPVADTGVTSEATLEVDPRRSVTVPIAAGAHHSLALMEEGTRVQAWGNNSDNQCRIPDFEGLKVVQITAGS